MSKLYFRNTQSWGKVFAVLFSKDEKVHNCVPLTETDSDGDYVLEFDCAKYNHLYFCSSDRCDAAQQTSKIFPGELSFGIEYKYNESQKRELSYLFSKDDKVTGHIDTYLLKDEVNLSYREGASKKINVFVPAGYDENTAHEVLYFFDAQNLFSNAGIYTENADPYGGWQLDVILNAVYHQCGKNILVVAVDNSDAYRMSELFMEPRRFGKLSKLAADIAEEEAFEGHLDELYNFIVQTAHPLVKAKYNVTETNMGIGGSSMGGIAAFYCALKCPGTFAYALSYSPAYGLYEAEAYERFFANTDFGKNTAKLPKIHIYCGEGDELEKQLVPAAKDMKSILAKYGYPAQLIAETYDPAKVHNEEAWRLILGESFSFFHKA